MITHATHDRLRALSRAGQIFLSRDPEQLGLVLRETENFRVFFDLCPLAEGHLMIVSKASFGCAGEIDTALFPELLALRSDVEQLLRSTYDRPVISYEHGRAGSCLTHNPWDQRRHVECHHFHLHFLPVQLDVHQPLSARYPATTFTRYDDIAELFARKGNYIYFAPSTTEHRFYAVHEKEVPPHHMRTVIGHALGETGSCSWEDDNPLFLTRLNTGMSLLKQEVPA